MRSGASTAPPGARAGAALLAALATFDAGCTTTVRVSPAELAPPSEPVSSAVVLLRDATRVEMGRPRLVGGAIEGSVNACEGSSCGEVRAQGRVRLRDVESVEVERFSAGLTVGGLLGVAAVVGVVALAVGSSGGSSSTPTPPTSDRRLSCPQVYSFDGRAWELDSGTFSGALFPAARRTDHDVLDHLAPSGGEYRLRMANTLDETDHTDALRLRLVDHAPGVRVVPTLDGRLLPFTAPRTPVAAADLRGADVLADVGARDGRLWRSVVTGRRAEREGDARDGVVLDFERPAEAREARLWFTGTTTPWAEMMLVSLLASVGPRIDAWYARLDADPAARERLARAMVREGMLLVSVWTGAGWSPRGYFWESGPELLKDQALTLPLDGVEGPRLRVRLESPVGFWVVDAASVEYGAAAPLEAREIAPRVARRATGEDVTATLAAADGRELVSPPGDAVELRFEAPAVAEGRARSVVLASTGWYRPHVAPVPDGDPGRVDRLLAEPGAASRQSLERLNARVLAELLR